jgi:hypothetical protein
VVDLTAAYAARGATRVTRGFAFTADFKQLVVVDEVEHPTARNVTWSMHTRAAVQLVVDVEKPPSTSRPRGGAFFSAKRSLAEPSRERRFEF